MNGGWLGFGAARWTDISGTEAQRHDGGAAPLERVDGRRPARGGLSAWHATTDAQSYHGSGRGRRTGGSSTRPVGRNWWRTSRPSNGGRCP